MTRVGLIGFGYWGPQLARNIRATPGLDLVSISEMHSSRLSLAQQLYPDVKSYAGACFDGIDAVVIATPVSTHFQLASEALAANLHVLITKPLAATVREAETLAESAPGVLMVDHTFLYTGAVRKIKEILPSLGELTYFDSVRINLGLFQNGCDVICDLAPHDFSILLYLLGETPTHVQVASSGEATAYVSLWFENGPLAHLHLNWLSPVKIRRVLIGGSQKMLLYDEEQPSEKVKVYDSGVTPRTTDEIHATLWDYRTGDCYVPHLNRQEALAVEMLHFRDCILGRNIPLSGAEQGIQVVQMLEAARASLTAGGKKVAL